MLSSSSELRLNTIILAMYVVDSSFKNDVRSYMNHQHHHTIYNQHNYVLKVTSEITRNINATGVRAGLGAVEAPGQQYYRKYIYVMSISMS